MYESLGFDPPGAQSKLAAELFLGGKLLKLIKVAEPDIAVLN